MNTEKRKSDSIRDEPNSRIRSLSPPKKQIRGKLSNSMYVGIDLHKKPLQVAIMDNDGKVLQNSN